MSKQFLGCTARPFSMKNRVLRGAEGGNVQMNSLMFAYKLVGSDLRKLGFGGGLEIRTLCRKGVGRVLETEKK